MLKNLNINDFMQALGSSGTTAQRPSGMPTGAQYYDTDLSEYVVWDGSSWIAASGDATTLEIGTVTATTLGITSDGSINDVILPEANTNDAGLLGASLWDKLSGIEAGAEVNDVNTTLQGNTFNGNSQLVQLNASGQYPALDGSLITNLSDGITNLSTTQTSEIQVIINSDTGSNATIAAASGSVAGVMTKANYDKLSGIEAGATIDQTAGEIEAIVSHDNLQGVLANEHIDWTADQGLTNIHTGNYVNTTYTAGTALDLSSTTFNVNLSELNTSTTNADGDYFVVTDTGGAQYKLTKANINLSEFNNDSNWSSSTGTVTSVGSGTGLSGGPITTTGTLTLDIAGATLGGVIEGGDIDIDASGVMTIGADKVTYSKIQNVATANTLLGSASAGGIVTELTDTQVRTILGIGAGSTYDYNTALTGANVFSNIVVTDGVVTNITTRAMNLGNFGVTSTSSELNILDGATLSTAELNYVDGVTSNIQTQLNSKLTTTSAPVFGTDSVTSRTANTTLSLAGNGTGIVEVNDDLEVTGDLTVQGTTTTINTETLVVEDKNIELGNVTTPTDITADGGGITLLGDTNKTILWINSTDSWDFNQNVKVTGTINSTGNITGNNLSGTNTGDQDYNDMISIVTATSSASYTPNLDNNFFEYTLTQNSTIANPTNIAKGQTGTLSVIMDSTGGWSLSFGTNWIFPNGAPTINTTADSINFFRYTVLTTSKILVEYIADL